MQIIIVKVNKRQKDKQFINIIYNEFAMTILEINK